MIFKKAIQEPSFLYEDPKLLDPEDPYIGELGQGSPQDDFWLAKKAPRYTSYPPATAFAEPFSVDFYKKQLAALPEAEKVSLYLHVPFCSSLCLYCGCTTNVTQQHDRISTYLDHVQKEIKSIVRTTSSAPRISRLHFGGGSPNYMSEKDMGMLFGTLARYFNLSNCDEIAMELDPRHVTKAQARALRMTGVNRVSLGVQDFDPDVQSAIGRPQPFRQVAEVYDLLQEQGIKNISFDLLYGLPLQSPASMAETARKVVDLLPSRVSLFSYAHVPQIKKHQRSLEQFVLPSPYAALALEKTARQILCDAGYVEIGMDHFALPEDSLTRALEAKKLRRNFQGYTDDTAKTLLGIGASSIGKTETAYFQNERLVDAYETRTHAEGFATRRGVQISADDRLRAEIIEEIMCYMSVNIEEKCRKYNYSLSAMAAELEELRPYIDQGLITMENKRLRLATSHRMAVRVIASVFDKTRKAEKAAVSRVV